jgi:hypothetical protein
VLYQLWRYGSAGTKSLWQLTAPQDGLYGFSKELIRLEDQGVVFGERSNQYHRQFTWTITTKGFAELAPLLSKRYPNLVKSIQANITKAKESERDTWYRENLQALMALEIVRLLSPWKNPETVTAREMTFTEPPKSKRWLPSFSDHYPNGLVMWPGPLKPRVIAVEVWIESKNMSALEKIVRAHGKTKSDKVLVVVPNTNRTSKFHAELLRSAVARAGLGTQRKFLVIEEDALIHGESSTVYNLEGKHIGSVESVLLAKPYEPHKLPKHAAFMANYLARPKVWGRAYQRS